MCKGMFGSGVKGVAADTTPDYVPPAQMVTTGPVETGVQVKGVKKNTGNGPDIRTGTSGSSRVRSASAGLGL